MALYRRISSATIAPVNTPAVTAYIAMGSNLGDRSGTILEAIRRLRRYPGIEIVEVSDLVENPALGGPADSPPFLNGAAKIRTTLSAADLLGKLLEVEQSLGRLRKERWGPRKIDLDLLLYGDATIEAEHIHIPHPRMQERRFVLQPLAKIAGEVVHPVLQRRIADLLNDLHAL